MSVRLRPLALGLVGCALLGLGACDAFQEPERFYDHGVVSPSVQPVDFSDLRPGQHVTGIVRVSLNLDSMAAHVARVRMSIGGAYVHELGSPPYHFEIDTWRVGEGPLDVVFSVYDRRARLGLLGMLGAPAHFLAARIVVDHRPPTPAEPEAFWEGGAVRLDWKPNRDPNFYAYQIVREDHLGDFSLLFDYEVGGYVIATLHDPEVTTYLDEAPPDVIGWEGRYRVAVTNRAVVEPGPWQTLVNGHEVTASGLEGMRSEVVAPDRRTVYGLGISSEVSATSLADLTRQWTVEPFGNEPFYSTPAHLVLAQDGSRLYVLYEPVMPGGPLRVVALDPATGGRVGRFDLPEGARTFVAGLNGRLYGVANGHFYIADGADGAVLASERYGFGEAPHAVATSVDGTSVYLVESRPQGATLSRVDVTADVIRMVVRQPWPRRPEQVAIGPDGAVYVLESNNTLVALHRSTLAPVRSLHVPNGVRTFEVGDGRMFVLSSSLHHNGLEGGEVREVALPGLEVTRSWSFRYTPQRVLVGAENVFVRTSTRHGLPQDWRIER